MAFLSIKKAYTKFIKRGKISTHGTVSKGKKYIRGKIYLKSAEDVGSIYQLYEVENMHIVKGKQHRKGRGYIVFIPK